MFNNFKIILDFGVSRVKYRRRTGSPRLEYSLAVGFVRNAERVSQYLFTMALEDAHPLPVSNFESGGAKIFDSLPKLQSGGMFGQRRGSLNETVPPVAKDKRRARHSEIPVRSILRSAVNDRENQTMAGMPQKVNRRASQRVSFSHQTTAINIASRSDHSSEDSNQAPGQLFYNVPQFKTPSGPAGESSGLLSNSSRYVPSPVKTSNRKDPNKFDDEDEEEEDPNGDGDENGQYDSTDDNFTRAMTEESESLMDLTNNTFTGNAIRVGTPSTGNIASVSNVAEEENADTDTFNDMEMTNIATTNPPLQVNETLIDDRAYGSSFMSGQKKRPSLKRPRLATSNTTSTQQNLDLDEHLEPRRRARSSGLRSVFEKDLQVPNLDNAHDIPEMPPRKRSRKMSDESTMEFTSNIGGIRTDSNVLNRAVIEEYPAIVGEIKSKGVHRRLSALFASSLNPKPYNPRQSVLGDIDETMAVGGIIDPNSQSPENTSVMNMTQPVGKLVSHRQSANEAILLRAAETPRARRFNLPMDGSQTVPAKPRRQPFAEKSPFTVNQVDTVVEEGSAIKPPAQNKASILSTFYDLVSNEYNDKYLTTRGNSSFGIPSDISESKQPTPIDYYIAGIKLSALSLLENGCTAMEQNIKRAEGHIQLRESAVLDANLALMAEMVADKNRFQPLKVKMKLRANTEWNRELTEMTERANSTTRAAVLGLKKDLATVANVLGQKKEAQAHLLSERDALREKKEALQSRLNHLRGLSGQDVESRRRSIALVKSHIEEHKQRQTEQAEERAFLQTRSEELVAQIAEVEKDVSLQQNLRLSNQRLNTSDVASSQAAYKWLLHCNGISDMSLTMSQWKLAYHGGFGFSVSSRKLKEITYTNPGIIPSIETNLLETACAQSSLADGLKLAQNVLWRDYFVRKLIRQVCTKFDTLMIPKDNQMMEIAVCVDKERLTSKLNIGLEDLQTRSKGCDLVFDKHQQSMPKMIERVKSQLEHAGENGLLSLLTIITQIGDISD